MKEGLWYNPEYRILCYIVFVPIVDVWAATDGVSKQYVNGEELFLETFKYIGEV